MGTDMQVIKHEDSRVTSWWVEANFATDIYKLYLIRYDVSDGKIDWREYFDGVHWHQTIPGQEYLPMLTFSGELFHLLANDWTRKEEVEKQIQAMFLSWMTKIHGATT